MNILNYVWRFAHSFDLCAHHILVSFSGVISEIIIFLGLLSLAYMDCRNKISGIVPTNDGSCLGGGIWMSIKIRPFAL